LPWTTMPSLSTASRGVGAATVNRDTQPLLPPLFLHYFHTCPASAPIHTAMSFRFAAMVIRRQASYPGELLAFPFTWRCSDRPSRRIDVRGQESSCCPCACSALLHTVVLVVVAFVCQPSSCVFCVAGAATFDTTHCVTCYRLTRRRVTLSRPAHSPYMCTC
jgi:hypothetical protein